MIAPDHPLLRKGQPAPRFNPAPYVAAAQTLRPAEAPSHRAPLAWAAVLIAVPFCWTATIVWAVDQLF